MENEKTKKVNILFLFIKMVIIFLVFDVINSNIYPIISRVLLYGRFGREAIIEMVCALLVLSVILLFKNTYIFSEKKEKFLSSLSAGGFMLTFAILITISNLGEIGSAKLIDIASLALYCLTIGIFEEFLCRGWIQNEFIERYASNRKQVILSIVLSSLIFGGMHISNIWIGGQGVVETFAQIIQATGLGILLGSIYYRTKNIWACVFLHGFWDFAIFLGEINKIKSCSEGIVTNTYLISTLIVAILMCAIYVLISLYILRKSKTTKIIEEYTQEEINKSEKHKDRYVYIIIALYFLISLIPSENNQVCYSYEDKAIPYEEVRYPVYDSYIIEENNIKIKLSINDSYELVINNLSNNKEAIMKDVLITNFIVVNNEGSYNILLRGLNEYESDTIIYHSNLINKSNIEDNEEYLTSIINSFEEIESAPTTNKFGYIISTEDNTMYPFIETIKSEQLVLVDNDFYVLYNKYPEESNENIEKNEDNKSEEENNNNNNNQEKIPTPNEITNPNQEKVPEQKEGV